MQNFNKFYNNKHTGRALHWKPSLGFADIKATLGDSVKHELQTSTYQMSILMLFNANSQMTYQQLLSSTQIGDLDMKCHIIPLL
jgi:Cullin family